MNGSVTGTASRRRREREREREISQVKILLQDSEGSKLKRLNVPFQRSLITELLEKCESYFCAYACTVLRAKLRIKHKDFRKACL